VTTAQIQGSCETEEPMLTISKVDEAIKKLKNNKATGMDLTHSELMQYAEAEYVK
jgi:hypothetical protein